MATAPKTLHRFSILLALCTFPLIFMGGMVTTKGAGMSVPDWPNSYGYNMFLFPVDRWIEGIFFEHTHRLLGTLVGFVAICVVFAAWAPARNPAPRRRLLWATIVFSMATLASAFILLINVNPEFFQNFQHIAVGFASLALICFAGWCFRRRDERRWMRWLTIGALVAVCFQGLLGGLRVEWVNLELAIIHACVAQAFFCLAAFLSVATSQWWFDVGHNPDPSRAEVARRIRNWALVCVIAIFAQLIVGAVVPHHRAGLAIHDLPLAFGKLLPPISQEGLDLVNQQRAWMTARESVEWSKRLDPVTMTQVWLHFGHRIGAIVVSILLIPPIVIALRRATDPRLRSPAWWIVVLLVTQLTLGILTVYYRKPAEIASLHVAVGALLLLVTFVLFARASRRYDALPRGTGYQPVGQDNPSHGLVARATA
jgi:cytochrome c oxidase assembly protein subunit 15